MRIKDYITGIRNMAPYIKESVKETAREIKGLALVGALVTGIGAVSVGLANIPEPQYDVWQVKREGNSVIAEKRADMLRYIRLTDQDGDGTVDTKYIAALPRPGCFGNFEPSELDQKTFDEVTK